MRRGRRISRWLAVAALAVGMTGYGGGDLAEGADPKPARRLDLGRWSRLLEGHARRHGARAERGWRGICAAESLGPLLQLGFTGDTERRLKGAPQAGVGLVHNTFRDGDTSWLIPIGMGADSALGDKLSMTGTLLLNFTDLDTGRGSGADVMPGFTIGVRFYVSVTGVVYWMLYRL